MNRKKFRQKSIVFLMFLLLFSLFGCEHKHDWSTISCTETATCSKCGEVRKAVPAHMWTPATCAAPQTCTVCGKSKGTTLGHLVETWTTTKEPTCSNLGEGIGICVNCNQETGIILNMLSHVNGEIKVKKEATLTEKGIKETHCALCNKVLATQEYVLSEREKQALFPLYYVDDLLYELSSNAYRAEQNFQDKYIQLTGIIKNIDSDGEYFSLGAVYSSYYDTIRCKFTSDEQRQTFYAYNVGYFIDIRCQIVDIGEVLGYTVDVMEILDE